jgi:hypothetical protein
MPTSASATAASVTPSTLEKLAGAACGRHRGEQRAHRADSQIRQRHSADRRPADRREEEGERRQSDHLGEREECQCRDHLRQPDRAPVARRQHERVEQTLLALGDEDAAEPEERGKDDCHPEQAELGQPRGAGRKREMEHRQDRDHEQEHRRQGVPRPQLEAQIVARQHRRVYEVAPHARASLPLASGATRSGS